MTANYDARGIPVPALDQPYPGAPMGEVWRRFWKKGVTFTGRASRSEYWKFTLLQIGITIALYIAIIMALVASEASGSGSAAAAGVGVVMGLLMLGWLLATVIPGIALTIRRLHDAGYPGTYYLFSFIPFIGSFILLILLAQDSNPTGARFDDRPAQVAYGYPIPSAGWAVPPAAPYPAPEPFGYRPDTAYGQPPTAYGQPARYATPPASYQPPGHGYPEPTFTPAQPTGPDPWSSAAASRPAPDDGWPARAVAPLGRWSVVLPDGSRFDLERPVILGRDPMVDSRYPDAALVTIGDPSVSPSHAAIDLVDGRPRVADLYSLAGTRLVTATGAVTTVPAGQAQIASDALRVSLGEYEIQLVEG
ncbi:MAG: DUF805 domain-containing protein [Propionicimonas sp.]